MKSILTVIIILLCGCASSPMNRKPDQAPQSQFQASGCTPGQYLSVHPQDKTQTEGCRSDRLTMSALILKVNPACPFGMIVVDPKSEACVRVTCPEGTKFIGEIMYKEEAYAFCEKVDPKTGKPVPIQ